VRSYRFDLGQVSAALCEAVVQIITQRDKGETFVEELLDAVRAEEEEACGKIKYTAHQTRLVHHGRELFALSDQGACHSCAHCKSA
jgi:hypothetical protein